MTTDDFTKAAHAEGQARIAAMLEAAGASDDIRAWFPAGFEKGAEWARTHLASQEPTDAEIEAAAKSLWAEIWLNPELHPWDTEATGAERASCRREARAALSAARAARRDEETR